MARGEDAVELLHSAGASAKLSPSAPCVDFPRPGSKARLAALICICAAVGAGLGYAARPRAAAAPPPSAAPGGGRPAAAAAAVVLAEEEEGPGATCSEGATGEATAPFVSLSGEWKDFCENKVPGPRSLPQWEGQNRCWEWMRLARCRITRRSFTWKQAQKGVAKYNLGPKPDEAPMEGLRDADVCDAKELGAALPARTAEEHASDLGWLRRTVAVYVLTSPSDKEHWSDTVKQLEELDIPFERIWSVNLTEYPSPKPEALPQMSKSPLGLAQDSKLIPGTIDWDASDLDIEEGILGHPGRKRSVGSAASTAAGHLHAMRSALHRAEGQPLALVLQDSVELSPDFVARLRAVLTREAPCDWSVISLKSRCPYGACISQHLARVFTAGSGPEDGCRGAANFGLLAMLYRLTDLEDLHSRLWDVVWHKNKGCMDVDVALDVIADRIKYYAVPGLQEPGFLSERKMTKPSRVR